MDNSNASLSDFFKMLSEEKSKPVETKKKTSFEDFFKIIAEAKGGPSVEEVTMVEQTKPEEKASETDNPIKTPQIVENTLGLFGGDPSEKNIDVLTPLNRDFVTHEDLSKHYKTFIARVQQQLSTVGGGGETKLRRLQDVDRSTIGDNRYLKYDASSGMFVFSPVVTEDVVTTHLYATVLVTSSSYNATTNDHYIGVNYNGICTINLPSTSTNGEMLIVKDESGNASSNPIKVMGNVDNDPGGFTLAIDNGSISLIYRNGWRII
jgi:hypothetical protein